MRIIPWFLVISIILSHSAQASDAKTKTKSPTKSKPISVLILFSGDYKSKFQFEGPLQQDIQGFFVDSPEFKSDQNCQLSAYFQIVSYAQAPHLKIDFKATCTSNQIKEKITLNPEYVRLKDLKTHSSSLYLSDQHKNVQFKILNLSY